MLTHQKKVTKEEEKLGPQGGAKIIVAKYQEASGEKRQIWIAKIPVPQTDTGR